MDLDLRTLYLAMLGTTFMMAVVLGAARLSNRRDKGIGYLVHANVLATLGGVLILLRSVVPDFLSIIIANLCLIASLLYLARAYRNLFDLAPRRRLEWVLLGVTAAAFCYLTYVAPDVRARIVVFAIIAAIPAYLTVFDLQKHISQHPRSAIIAQLFFFGFYGTFMVFRAATTPFGAEIQSYLATTNVIETMLIFLSIFLSIGWNLGYLWIVYSRADVARANAVAELEHANSALTRTNTDLERFASVVSHDLKAPLNTVMGYVGLLGMEAETMANPKAALYAANVKDGAKRMAKFIDDVLAYAKIKDGTLRNLPVNMEEACDSALENLNSVIEETKANVVVAALPYACGDATHLTRVFQNLIDNAVKYRRPGSVPQITIDAALTDDAVRFTVRDDGVGMTEHTRTRIFDLFERNEETLDLVSGTGLGLATCKEIIQRHGGKIWVESSPGTGSTFYFTLPVTSSSNEER